MVADFGVAKALAAAHAQWPAGDQSCGCHAVCPWRSVGEVNVHQRDSACLR